MKPELLLNYRVRYSPGDPLDYTDQEISYVEWEPYNIYLDEKGKRARDKCTQTEIHVFDYNFRVKIGQEVWLVVVIYQSGGSFEVSYGNGCAEGIYKTKEKADKVANLIEEDDKEYLKARWNSEAWLKYKPKYKKPAIWHGHFERFEQVKVIKFVVE